MRRNWAATWLWVCVLALWTCNAVGTCKVQAEEPYRQFLDRLKGEGLFDLALFYLEDLAKNPQVDENFLRDLQLERANLLQEAAAGMPPRSPGRTKRLDDAEKAFEAFIAQHKDHPRRGEARVGLGNLLLARAEELKTDDPKVANPEAAKFYGEAQKVFSSTQEELKVILQQIQGARIDPADEAKKELRDKLRGDYRRAELLTAFSTEHRGRCYVQDTAEWKKDLEEALKAYTEFYTHEKDRQEARNIALFYRSGIQRDLGKVDDAADGYMRILGIDGINELRPLQFKSLCELIKMWANKDQGKFAATIELIERWEKLIRPDERSSQDVIAFQLAGARAKLAYAQLLQGENKDDRNISRLRKDVRDDLKRLVAISGPHQGSAREIMAELGMGREKSDAPVELPKVTSYDQAIKEAESRFDALQTELVTQQTLQESLDKEADEAKKTDLKGQLETANSSIARLEEQTAELYRTAIRMFDKGGDISDVNQTRYRLAYIELQRGNPWAAIAIGEFLAQQLAGTPTGLQAATISLAGYRELINASDEAGRLQVALQLQPFAEFMVSTWPEAKETQAAASTLVQLAMKAGNMDLARSYLAKLPGESSRSLRRDIGIKLASDYFLQDIKLTDGAEPPAEHIANRDTATELLSEGLKGITKDQIDGRTIEAINLLVRLLLASGKVEDATKWVSDPELAPVPLIRAQPALVEDRITKLNSYRTALQATVSQMAGGGENNEQMTKEIETLIGEMKTAAGEDAEGTKLLTGIFVSLARDLQDLVTGAKSNDVKQKLADSMILMCKQVAASSEEYSTKLWAGSTLSNVAGKLGPSAAKTRQALQRESAALLESILAKGAQTPGWIPGPNGELAVRAALAEGLRNSGQYQEAFDQLSKVIAQKETVLDFQVSAAELLTAWANSGAKDKFDGAINGISASKIWGWKGISSRLQRSLKDQTKVEPFMKARLNLSQTLMQYALAETDRKTELLELAAREIGSTRFIKQDMGGPAWLARFDTLMKNIQKELGKEQVGLK